VKPLRRLRYWLRRREEEAALAEEMEHHRAMLGKRGASAKFGNATQAKEDARRVWIWPWLESVTQDLRYALRGLRRQPGFALAAILAISLGLGINASLFSAFNAVALQPWPVHAPDRVITLYNILPREIGGDRYSGFSISEARYLSENARNASAVVAYRPMGVRLGFEPADEASKACFVTGDFFDVLGIPMALGRGFIRDEDKLGQPVPVAILGYRMWRDRFGADPEIVGKEVRVDDVPLVVVGVVAESFQGVDLMEREVWLPMAGMELLRTTDEGRVHTQSLLNRPDHCCSPAAARLAPGATRESAAVELDLLHRRYARTHRLETGGLSVRGTENFGVPGAMRAIPILGLFGVATLLVLLLACANVGNLLLARGATRAREFAMRRSLGATRGRLVRQLMTESLILGGVGGALAMAIATVLPEFLIRRAFGPPPMRFLPDHRVLLVVCGLSIFASLAFGLLPAIRSTRDLSVAAKSRFSARGALLAVQVAVSVILLVNAGLLTRAVERARAQNPGFAIENRTVVALQFPANPSDAARRRNVAERVAEELRRLPGVRDTGLTLLAPLGSSRSFTSFRLPGDERTAHRDVRVHSVSPGYLKVLRVPVAAGRDLEPADAGRRTILVNQTLANLTWPNAVAVGKTILSNNRELEVVGVVADAYLDGWQQVVPAMFQPFEATNVAHAVVETGGPPISYESIRKAVAQIDSKVQIQAYPLSDNVERQLKPVAAGAEIASMLGVLALVLASVGVFGVFSYVVQRNTREIGIRMAIGARPGQVIWGVLGGSGIALLVGAVVGVAGAIPLGGVLESQFVAVRKLDAAAYLGVAVVLVAAGLAASYVPARRASRIDPIEALRVD